MITYHEQVPMNSIEVFYLSETSLELFCRNVLYPYTGRIVFVTAIFVHSSDMNYRVAVKLL